MKKNVLLSNVRALLNIGGGLLAAKGIVDKETLEVLLALLPIVFSIGWSIIHHTKEDSGAAVKVIKKTIPLLALSAALVFAFGCSSFSTTQTDTSYDKGHPSRTVTTTAKARTLFDAGSQLANFKASQTDKTQSAAVGSLNQQSSSTNAADVAGQIVGAAVSAAIKAR